MFFLRLVMFEPMGNLLIDPGKGGEMEVSKEDWDSGQ